MNHRVIQVVESCAEGLGWLKARRLQSLGALLRRSVPLTGAVALAFVGAPAQAQTTYDQTRTSGFTYYGVADGALNGLLKTETVEPQPGNAQLCVTTTYTYDAYGNKATATTANCASATGNALFTSRSSGSTYASQTVTVSGASGVVIPLGAFATSVCVLPAMLLDFI